MNRTVLKIVLPIVVVVVGLAGAFMIASARQAPPRTERTVPGPLVEVVTVNRASVPVEVEGHGEVRARVMVEVVPQVAGRVVEVHPGLVQLFSGGLEASFGEG